MVIVQRLQQPFRRHLLPLLSSLSLTKQPTPAADGYNWPHTCRRYIVTRPTLTKMSSEEITHATIKGMSFFPLLLSLAIVCALPLTGGRDLVLYFYPTSYVNPARRIGIPLRGLSWLVKRVIPSNSMSRIGNRVCDMLHSHSS